MSPERGPISEFRRDMRGSEAGRVNLGLAVSVATIAVTASGWPHGDAVQRGLFLVLGALPAAGIGLGLIVGAFIQARADRLSRRKADVREIQALRAKIAQDLGVTLPGVPASPVVDPAGDPAVRRPPIEAVARSGRLVGARRRGSLLSREGMLGLR